MTTTTTKSKPARQFSTDDQRWRAVARRDQTADGHFVYSVKTTGIYCRPSCSARLANRKNVRFHSTPMDAERAGFRPCKRCCPNKASAFEPQKRAVAHACRLIDQSSEPLDLESLAAATGMSPSHFHRIFKASTGLTPKSYMAARRSQRVRNSLATSRTITTALYDAGFKSNGRFYATSSRQLGMTPTAYRRGGACTSIRFAVGECSLGAILVAATEKGICAIALGDDPSALVRDLQDQFPKANLVGGDAQFERWVAQVVAFVERPATGLDLPLDIQGTAFQRRFWQALSNIPCGQSTTYAKIARRLSCPSAVRAVATAIASNKIAVAIPCHRVIRTDGSLSGYRWGVERKAALLARERGDE